MFKFLLFDLDGTLVDTNEIIIRSFEHTLKNHLDYEVERKEIMEIFGEPLFDQMAHFSADKAEFLCKAYRDFYSNKHLELTRPFPGIKEVLSQLKDQGVTMAVVTNKSRKFAELGLKDFELWPYFEYLVASDDVVQGKPDPEGLFKAMEAIGASPEETLFLGDSPHDLEAAKNAGIKSGLVSWHIFPENRFEEIQPDYHIHDINDLMELIK